MVGVLNGKKGKAVSVVVVAFLLCGVFGGLVVKQSLAFTCGYTVPSTRTSSSTSLVMAQELNITIPTGYQAHITALHIYLDGNGTSTHHADLGLYDGVGMLLGSSGGFDVASTAAWYNLTVDIYGLSGTYYLAFCVDNANVYQNRVSAAGWEAYTCNIGTIYPLQSSRAFSYWDTYQFAAYFDYHIESFEATMSISDWGGLAVSLFLIGVSLLLALKSRSWAVNFLFGLSTVGFLGWTFANATVELYGGWLVFMVLVGAVLVLVKGAVLVRASGV